MITFDEKHNLDITKSNKAIINRQTPSITNTTLQFILEEGYAFADTKLAHMEKGKDLEKALILNTVL